MHFVGAENLIGEVQPGAYSRADVTAKSVRGPPFLYLALIRTIQVLRTRRGAIARSTGSFPSLDPTLSSSIVRNILLRRDLNAFQGRTGPTWGEFLNAHAAMVLDCDFFTVDTVPVWRFHILVLHRTRHRKGLREASEAHPAGVCV